MLSLSCFALDDGVGVSVDVVFLCFVLFSMESI